MATLGEKIKRCIMSVSYQERKIKSLQKYKEEITYLKSMEYDELNLEYVNLKSEYEHKKYVLSLFVITILIALLMNLWKYFFGFIENLLQFAFLYQEHGAEISNIVFICSLILISFITIMILTILLLHVKRIREIYRRLIVIEEIRNKRHK